MMFDADQVDRRVRLSPGSSPIRPSADDERLDPLAIFRLVRRQFLLIAAVTTLFTMLALPLVLSLPRYYYGQTQFLIRQPLTADLSLPGLPASDPLNVTVEVERLQARPVSLELIERLALDELPEFAAYPEDDEPGLRALLKEILLGEEAGSDQSSDPMSEVLLEYYEALRITHDPYSEAVSIGFTSLDPRLAAQVPNTLLQVYLERRAAAYAEQVDKAKSWLSDRIADQRLRIAELKASIEVSESAILSPREGSALQPGSLDAISARRLQVLNERKQTQATIQDLRNGGGLGDTAGLVDTPHAQELRRALQTEQRELEVLLQTLGDNHEQVVAKRRKIEAVGVLREREVQRYIAELERNVLVLGQEADELEIAIERRLASDLDRRVEESRRLTLKSQLLEKELELADFEAQMSILDARGDVPVATAEVLSPATIPLDPTGRSRTLYLVIAIIVGGCFGLTLATARELLDDRVRSFDQLRWASGWQRLGLLPRAAQKRRRWIIETIKRSRHHPFVSRIRGMVADLSQENGTPPKMITVTSAVSDNASATLAVALGTCLAQAGKNVLLVVANPAFAGSGGIVDGKKRPGLSDFFSGRQQSDEVIHFEEKSQLYIIEYGKALGEDPLHRSSLSEELNKIASSLDATLIVVAPPVLSTSNSPSLLSQSEAVVLTLHWGKVRLRLVEAIQNLFERHGLQDPYVCITDVNMRRHRMYDFTDSHEF